MNDKIIQTRSGTVHFNPSRLNPYSDNNIQREGFEGTAKTQLNDFVSFTYSKELLNEQVKNNPGKPLVISGIFQRANQKNQNGRVYGKDILTREVNKYTQNFINQNRALGELDHPDTSVVSLANVSHIVRALSWNGYDLIGQIEILSTPKGNVLKELLLAGVQIGISSRGMGSVKKNNMSEDVVQEDFELIAFDLVANPSIVNAGFQLHESVQSSTNMDILEPKDAINLLHNTYNEVLEENYRSFAQRFANFRQS